MKYLKIFVLILFIKQVSFAQDIGECRKIVDLTIESINNGSTDCLHTYLSDDFTIAGQKGKIAKMVLKQLFSQLGEKVKSHREIKERKMGKGLELVYNIDYMKMGHKEATFIFNESNLLTELTLFKMERRLPNRDSGRKENYRD